MVSASNEHTGGLVYATVWVSASVADGNTGEVYFSDVPLNVQLSVENCGS